jgi:hypothetical protein
MVFWDVMSHNLVNWYHSAALIFRVDTIIILMHLINSSHHGTCWQDHAVNVISLDDLCLVSSRKQKINEEPIGRLYGINIRYILFTYMIHLNCNCWMSDCSHHSL